MRCFFQCVYVGIYILHKVGTLIVQSFHADCIRFAIHQKLVSIKIKFKLSSSQEPSQCLLNFILGFWDFDFGLGLRLRLVNSEFKVLFLSIPNNSS